MIVSYRRAVVAVASAALLVSMAAGPVFAQATVGPSGGVGSTTAPSNSAGTPAGGTGVLSTTRVGPATVAPTAATPAARPHRVRHPARHRARAVAPAGTQSTSGLNGSAPVTR